MPKTYDTKTPKIKDIKLIKASAIVDFYVSRKKYNSYKKEATKKRYVESVLFDYFQTLVHTVHNGCEIRYCRVPSNSFWGQELTIINDLGYNWDNQKEERTDDKLPIRIFGVDLIGVCIDDSVKKYNDIVKEDVFILSFSSVIIL